MPKSYSLHIAGEIPGDQNNAIFKAGADLLFQMAKTLDFTPMMIFPDVDLIVATVDTVSKQMNSAGGGRFLLTYTGHGTNSTACGKLGPGQGWALNNMVNLHEASLRRLLIGKFQPPIIPIALSDSCFSLGMYHELLYKLIASGREALNLHGLHDVLSDAQLQLVEKAVKINEEICKQTQQAQEPNKAGYVYLSAGHAKVNPAALSKLLHSIFDTSPPPQITYRELKKTLKSSLDSTEIEVPSALLDTPALVPEQ